MSDFENICGKIEGLRSEMIEFEKSLCANPALSPENGGEGEWDKAEFVSGWLREQGFSDVERIDAPDPRAKNGVRPSVVALVPGKSKRKLWIMSHLDVVPAGDRALWESDPWVAYEKDGKLFGRGVEDNQQGMTASIFAGLAFLRENIQPELTLAFLLCADEETHSKYGLEYLLENGKPVFDKDDLIIVPDAGNHEGTLIDVSEKSVLWLKVTVTGKQCHASRPDQGVNAMRASSDAIVKLERLYEIFNQKDELFSPDISTFEPTRRLENVENINTIPGSDVFFMDCRVLPRIDLEDVKKAIEEICEEVGTARKVSFTIEAVMESPAAPPTAPDAEVVLKIQTAVSEVYQREAKPIGVGGGTVAACFRRKGLPAAVWSTLDMTAHQPNEYCIIDNLIGDAKVFAHIALQ